MFFESGVPEGVPLNIDCSELEFCNIVSMCIKEKYINGYFVPDNLRNLVESLLFGVYEMNEYLHLNDHRYNCYLTLKRQFVSHGTVGNRDGFHSDGFLSDQLNFIWSDSQELGTVVACGLFTLTPDHEKSLAQMEEQAVGMPVELLNHNTLYYMPQACIHKPQINLTGAPILRTFAKLTFTKEDFNGFGNAWNYKLPHIKPTTARALHRNHGRL